MSIRHSRSGRFSRRQALSLLGAGAGFGLFSAAHSAGAPRRLAQLSQAGSLNPTKLTFPEGAIIRTILEDLPPEALGTGTTLFHEHLSAAYSRTERQTTLPPPSSADIGPVVEDVKAAAKEGVTCIVDGGHPDMGRNMAHLRQISIETGVRVVASGGYYLQNTYPLEIASQSEDQIAASLAQEATAERYGAFGEIGQSPNAADFTPDERKVFRAVGKAQVRTGLPIFTHNPYATGPNVPRETGLRQLDLLESVGVNPQHVTIGHACCLDDPGADIIKQVAKRGAFVGFDRVTAENFLPDAKRVAMILAFLDAGYGDRLLLSSDLRRNFNRTSTLFVPKLGAAGVKQEIIRSILVDNPRRFLAFVPKKAAA